MLGCGISTILIEAYRDLPSQLSGEPEERLFEVVVGFGGDFKVLEVLLSVESHSSSLYFPLLSHT